MKILSIETSCDETAAAVVEDGVKVLSNVVVSQVDIFAEYGGVIPEVAARNHLEVILPVVKKALADAGITKEEVDAIAVTHTPGLLGSLLIGTLTARGLAILWRKPLYAVHHLKSHIYANWLNASARHPEAKPRDAFKLPEGHPEVDIVQSSKSSVVSFSPSKTLTSSLESSSGRAQASDVVGRDTSKVFEEIDGTVRATVKVSEGLKDTIDISDACNIVASGCPSGSLNVAQSYGYPEFPLVALVVSGGHTQIIKMQEHNQFEIVGTTRDDAVGECFDKVAKILGLPYPGGPSIAKAAKNGDPERYKLPKPQIAGLDFSFSGLKTAVLRAVQAECGLPITTPSFELKKHLSERQVADFAASFQKVACEILIDKLEMALRDAEGARSVVLAGGVSANECLRERVLNVFSKPLPVPTQDRMSLRPVFTGEAHPTLSLAGSESSRLREDSGSENNLVPSSAKLEVYFPELKYSGDNAAMVGAAAYFEIESGVRPVDPYELDIMPRSVIA